MQRVMWERIRDAVRDLGRFTCSELAREVGCDRKIAAKAIVRLEKRGMVVATDERRKHNGPGRPAKVYAFQPPVGQRFQRVKRTPVELEVVREFAARPRRASGPVASGRRRRRGMSPEIRALADAAEAAGWRTDPTDGGHVWFVPPDPTKDKILAPTSPSDHRSAKNLRALMKRAGIAA